MISSTPATVPGLITQFWHHQDEAFAFAKDLPASLLAMRMGTGKSLVTISLLQHWRSQTVLILCPKSVVSVWPEQFARHTDGSAIVVPLEDGSVAKRVQQAEAAWRSSDERMLVLVLNYEAAIQPAMSRWLLGRLWDVVVCDESHKIKAHRGVTSRLCWKIGKLSRRRLGLTGTPMSQGPLDAFAQYRFLDDRIFGRSFVRFRSTYANCDPMFPSLVWSYKNLDDLYNRFISIAFQVSEQVLDLPPVQDITRTCELGKDARKVYDDLKKDFYATLDQYGHHDASVTAPNVLTKLLRLQQVTSGYVRDDQGIDRTLNSGKRDLLTEVLDEFDPREPVVVFCRFRHDLTMVREVSAKLGRGYCELSGLHNDLHAWQQGRGTILGVQIQSGGVGVDLTRARYCVYVSVGYSLGDFQQSRARLHRPGQSGTVFYVHLLAEHTIDSDIYRALQKKQDVIEALLEGRME